VSGFSPLCDSTFDRDDSGEREQADLFAGGLEGTAGLGAAVDLYLLDVDVLAGLAEQVRRVRRAGGSVDARPDAPRVDVDGADVVDLPAAGQAHVHHVHLDELPDPACLSGDPPLAVAGLPVALAHAFARLGVLAEADPLDLVVLQQFLQHAPDAGHGDLMAGPTQGLPELLDAPDEVAAEVLDLRPHLRRPRRALRRRLAPTGTVSEAGWIVVGTVFPGIQRRQRVANSPKFPLSHRPPDAVIPNY